MTQRIAWDAFEDLKYKLFFIYRISSQVITNLSLVTFNIQTAINNLKNSIQLDGTLIKVNQSINAWKINE